MWPMRTPVLHKLSQRLVIFRGFSKKFSELLNSLNILHWKPAKKIKLGVVLGQNLSQIMSSVMKKVKKQVHNIIRFFSYFTWDLVVKSPEWKFIAIIARNTEF